MSLFRVFLTVVFILASMSVASANSEDTEPEGGILGTGIHGTITALGSIYVNGQHILFDQDMPVHEGVSAQFARQLRPGHTVAVVAQPAEAASDTQGQWHASFIRQVTPLVGPLKKSPDGRLSVMGTTVLLDQDSAVSLPQNIRDQDWVAISGLWQNGRVIATRIDPVAANSQARIEGTVLGLSPGQPLRIGGTDVTGLRPSHIQDGDVVRAIGIPTPTSLAFETLETGVFAATPQVVFSEGYFSVPTATGLYTLLGADVVSFTDTPAMINPWAKQFVCSNKGQLFPSPIDQTDPKAAEKITEVLTECLSDVDQ